MSTTTLLDETHDPALKSWVASANAPDGDFPLQNLPFGRFRRRGSSEPWRIGVAIGEQVLDLKLALSQCPWSRDLEPLLQPLAAGDLLDLMQRGAAARRQVRAALSHALRDGSEQAPFLELCLVARADIELALPCRIGEYTDFYTGIHHATAVGKLFRPDNPLLPNYKWVPIGYHGRVSSIGVSGQQVHRPRGQLMGPDAKAPVFEPARRLDYELELGVLVGRGNADGTPMTMAQAEDDWFGLVLLNDWSARDIQAWEYQPLGPFLSKNFGTTISPWVVTAGSAGAVSSAVRTPRWRPAAAAASEFRRWLVDRLAGRHGARRDPRGGDRPRGDRGRGRARRGVRYAAGVPSGEDAEDPDVVTAAREEAVRRAQGADVVVAVVGEPPYAETPGDTTTAALPAGQAELLDALEATGKPVVIVVMAGRPLMMGPQLDGSAAALMAYLPGTREAGRSPTCCSARSTRADGCRSRGRSASIRCRSRTTGCPASPMTRATRSGTGSATRGSSTAASTRLFGVTTCAPRSACPTRAGAPAGTPCCCSRASAAPPAASRRAGSWRTRRRGCSRATGARST